MHKKNPKGFTLIEILVVLAIIGVLSTIVTVAVKVARDKAKNAGAKRDIDQITKAIQMLGNDTMDWPGNQDVEQVGSGANNEICGQDINANDCAASLLDDSSGIMATDGSYPGWSGPYMLSIPLDPWGREYFFDSDYQIDVDSNPCGCGGGGCTDAVVIGSYGPDEQGVPAGGTPGAYGCDDVIKIIYQ